MKKYILLFIASLVGMASLSAQKDSTTHTSKSEKYKISYPADWKIVDKSISALIDFGASSPLENESDKFSENFNVVIDNSDLTGISLEQYSELSTKGIKSYLKTAKIISSEISFTNNGTPCAIVVYTHIYSGIPLKVLVFMYFGNEKAYGVTCTAHQTSFDNYFQSFMSIGKSMEFTQ